METDFTEGLMNKKVPFQVYVAKYNYDPDQYSPNENPDAELILLTGDYIFIYGDTDEVRVYYATFLSIESGLFSYYTLISLKMNWDRFGRFVSMGELSCIHVYQHSLTMTIFIQETFQKVLVKFNAMFSIVINCNTVNIYR